MSPKPDSGARARVTAVVLNYNGRELLATVLGSLLGQTYADRRVVLVDNGSTDGSVALVRERWPGVEVLALPENVGVAAALNRGILASADSDYVALLNNDLELEPDWLGRLVSVLDAHPRACSATGKMLNFHRRTELDGAGDLLMWSGAATHRGIGEVDRGQYDQSASVFSPCAGAAIFRRSAFQVVGLFDEDFFAYQEDIDWGLRAQLAGFESRYEPAAVAYHMGGATTRREPRRYELLQRRNQILVVIKDYPARALLRHGGKVLSYQAAWIVASIHDRRAGDQLRALGAVGRALPATLAKRRQVQRRRRVSLAELDSVMTPEPYAGESMAQRARTIAGTLVRGPG